MKRKGNLYQYLNKIEHTFAPLKQVNGGNMYMPKLAYLEQCYGRKSV